jgi:hypothetical protein
MILLFGMSKGMAGEETGWKPVCRDHRVAGQAGEEAWLTNDDDHYKSWLMAEMSAAMILPFRTIAQPDRSSRAACSNASAVT